MVPPRRCDIRAARSSAAALAGASAQNPLRFLNGLSQYSAVTVMAVFSPGAIPASCSLVETCTLVSDFTVYQSVNMTIYDDQNNVIVSHVADLSSVVGRGVPGFTVVLAPNGTQPPTSPKLFGVDDSTSIAAQYTVHISVANLAYNLVNASTDGGDPLAVNIQFGQLGNPTESISAGTHTVNLTTGGPNPTTLHSNPYNFKAGFNFAVVVLPGNPFYFLQVPAPTSLPTTPASSITPIPSSKPDSAPLGLIFGILGGVLAAVILIVLAIVVLCCCCRRRQPKEPVRAPLLP